MLTWDRIVEFDNDQGGSQGGITGSYDIGDTFETYDRLEDVVNDLNIHLVRRGEDISVARSDGNVTFDVGYNLEHLFFKIPSTEQYDIVVEHIDNGITFPFGGQEYGIAWWGATDAQSSADFDNDGDVDGADFLAWQRNPRVGSLSDWQS